MSLDQAPRKSARVVVPSGWLGAFSLAIGGMMLLGCNAVSAEALPIDFARPVTMLTNAWQVRAFAARKETSFCFVHLEGVVLWVSPEQGQLILQDDSGGVMIKTDFFNQPSVHPGQRARLEGDCLVGAGHTISGATVDDDGLHSMIEKTGTVYLSAGLHPIAVKWFNGSGDFGLSVECMGPRMARQRVPDAFLFHEEADPVGGTNRLVPGLDYRCYEGPWSQLPEFSRLSVLKKGSARNFDLQVRTRDTNVGLVYSGWFAAPRSGDYAFWLTSDDGSKLYIGDHPIGLSVLGNAKLPEPRLISLGQFVPDELECRRVAMEGVITGGSKINGGVCLELTSGFVRTYLKVGEGEYEAMALLWQSRVRVTGIYQSVSTAEGQTAPSLLVSGMADIVLQDIAPTHWADYPVLPIQALAETNWSAKIPVMVHVRGMVCLNDQGCLAIDDGTGRIRLEPAGPPPRMGEQVEALGWYGRQQDEAVLRDGYCRVASSKADGHSGVLPLLTEAVQVKSLSRSEALRSYPVRIQGVITAQIGSAYVIQDSTASVFLSWEGQPARERPDIGDCWEIEGETSAGFAPDIRVSRAQYLQPGVLPEPLRPAGDELVNGSLDTEYIEIQGIATAINGHELALLTHEGEVRVELNDLNPKDLADLQGLEDALVRVRGSCTQDRDKQQRKLPLLRLFGASFTVDDPVPSDPFDAPLKRVSDLFYFDAHADALRRVRTSGQVVHESHGEYFLMDGADGLRFISKTPVQLETGDLVEVVGFPDMRGPSPVLRETVVRRTGKASLPPAQARSDATILDGKLDATLVRLESQLVSISTEPSEQVLALQNGHRGYVARLENSRGLLSALLPGSRLELTGVYAGQGGVSMGSRHVDSFELLLNSPADVTVLDRPSWWTIRRALNLVGGLGLGILGALAWIALLHRQVEERSRQLTSEIKGREQAERQRALEEERARIAQDLHDDLGAALTEIRFLSAVESRDALVPQATRSQLTEVSEKSRQLVSSLDEIVWAVNPANDSLPSLGAYLRHVAEEFFRSTLVRCRLDVDQSLPLVALTSAVRHNLYLAVREALNNIAKHSHATEAWLRIHWRDQTLHIVVEDNGCGFSGAEAGTPGNGLANMRRRLEKIGGRFECDTRAGCGTVCRLDLPLS